jgi:hypothetical protein
MNDLLTIGLWNVEWASRTDRGHFFVPRLAELSCDVRCVTEGNADLLPKLGHIITSDADYGYSLKGERCKVLLWSRAPWKEVTLSARRYSLQGVSWPARPLHGPREIWAGTFSLYKARTKNFTVGVTQSPLGCRSRRYWTFLSTTL